MNKIVYVSFFITITWCIACNKTNNDSTIPSQTVSATFNGEPWDVSVSASSVSPDEPLSLSNIGIATIERRTSDGYLYEAIGIGTDWPSITTGEINPKSYNQFTGYDNGFYMYQYFYVDGSTPSASYILSETANNIVDITYVNHPLKIYSGSFDVTFIPEPGTEANVVRFGHPDTAHIRANFVIHIK